ncbi:DUF2254 family protein, partial [Nocardiopsis lucentensis]|uniref:DUF2254 family protein n=1 Tax=Nocardiopsis lucentensis TaxID=53441 RepID=UPI00035F59F5
MSGPDTPASRRRAGRRRESRAERRAWSRLRSHLRGRSMWGVPFRLFLTAIAVGLLVPWFDRALARAQRPYPDLDTGTIAGILGTISGAMMTLSGLVFTALTAAMSFSTTSLSIRIVPVFRQDTVIRWGLGLFVGTFIYSLIVAVGIATGVHDRKPWAATSVAVIATVGCGIMLVAVVVRVCQQLSPAILLRRLAADGYRGMGFDPAPFHTEAATVSGRHLPEGHVVRRTRALRHGDTLLAVHTRRLLDIEADWDMRIELVPMAGTAVQYGGILFRTSAPTSPAQNARLLRALAFGDTYSPHSGSFGAIRSMADIALKALSPAVNDPTRAVQALDQIEDILARLSPRIEAERVALAGDPDATVVQAWSRGWEDYVAAGTDEIRQFGTSSVQVQRRLRALYASLLAQ